MKLRNKKTGEIVEAHEIDLIDENVYLKIFRAGDYDTKQYNSLAEFNEEWTDYEEPKEYWAIDCFSPDGELVSQFGRCSERIIENRKQIGNYFETREEAEKTLEKLKAWKRLKDKGFRFDGYNACSVDYDIDEQYRKYISEDLNLLFGGEERNYITLPLNKTRWFQQL